MYEQLTYELKKTFVSYSKDSELYRNSAIDNTAVFQWWYFDAVLDDSSRLMTFFLPKNCDTFCAADDNATPMFNIVLRQRNGKILRGFRFFPSSQLKNLSQNYGAKFGDHSSVSFEECANNSGRGRYHICASAERISYDVFIEPELEPWTPLVSDGYFSKLYISLIRHALFTKDYFYYVPFVPRGKLYGRITVDGKSKKISGTAYHERGKISFPLKKFLRAWYWLHIH